MKCLIFNRGSSNIKCSLYEFHRAPKELIPPLWEAQVENEGGTQKALSRLLQGKSDQIDVIGHRIVHGGKTFTESALIDADVKQKMRALSELAPLHQLLELEGIEALEKRFPGVPQVAVFDTAFHRGLPLVAKVYPGPYRWFEEGIQRYGFHGISFQYCVRRSGELLGERANRLVICHLGAGASLCAVKEGKSVDTTMGFTPLEGIMMNTRSGSIDPGILLHLLTQKKRTAAEISNELYEASGLLGISGVSEDMREITKACSRGDDRAQLAFDMYIYRLNAHIGAMIAALQGIDALVFTGGIGENTPLLRARVCANFAFLGVGIAPAKNALSSKEDRDLSSPNATVKTLLIHTQEAFEIAQICWQKIHKKKERS